MTDDIVTRLRNYDFLRDGDHPEVWMNEAADDIQDYRKDLKRHFDMITEQRKQIELLTADRDKWKRLFLEMYEKDGTTNEMMYAYRKEKW